jgi:hypothetical protein
MIENKLENEINWHGHQEASSFSLFWIHPTLPPSNFACNLLVNAITDLLTHANYLSK